MSNPPPGRPEHTPRGYEWLPEAYKRDVEPDSAEARETVRQALAEGDIEAKLHVKVGKTFDVFDHMWAKWPFADKVYPRFEDGWMRMSLRPSLDGPYVEGWIFVRKGALGEILGKVDPYHIGTPGRPTIKHLINIKYQRRVDDGDACPKISAEAQVLHNWAKETHPSAQTPTPRTIENQIRPAFHQNRTK